MKNEPTKAYPETRMTSTAILLSLCVPAGYFDVKNSPVIYEGMPSGALLAQPAIHS